MTDQTDDLATLDQLAALGMDLARAITAQGLESGDPASVADAFAKVSRSVRQTILLKDRLIKGISYDKSQRRMRRKIHLEDALNDIIDEEASDSVDYERLHTEAAERLEAEDDDLFDLPFPDAINILRKAIGLEALPLDGEGLGWGGGTLVQNLEREAQAPISATGSTSLPPPPTLPFLHRGGRVADGPPPPDD